MLEAIELIDKYASRGRIAFDEDELIRVWIVHIWRFWARPVADCLTIFEKPIPMNSGATW